MALHIRIEIALTNSFLFSCFFFDPENFNFFDLNILEECLGFGNWICFNCWKCDACVIDVNLLVILILILCHWFKFTRLV